MGVFFCFLHKIIQLLDIVSQIDTNIVLLCIIQQLKLKEMFLTLVIIAITADIVLYLLGGIKKWGK